MINGISEFINGNYECYEYRHAHTILKEEFAEEYNDLVDLLTSFRLDRSDILMAGGSKSPIAKSLDKKLYSRGWEEKSFNTEIVIDGRSSATPTHKIDCYRNRIALDIEWNNKDPFFDRDLNNYRLLFDLRAISVAIIITRSTSLQGLFNKLGKGSSYGASTTHIDKLLPRISGGGSGGCPVLVFGIKESLYNEN